MSSWYTMMRLLSMLRTSPIFRGTSTDGRTGSKFLSDFVLTEDAMPEAAIGDSVAHAPGPRWPSSSLLLT